MTPEYIPAWDNGTLQPLEKMEVHKKGLRHKAISVFLFSGKELLIQQRALSKYHTPGLWANTCCTHPYWQETSEACAKRRLYQELGINVSELFYKDKIEYTAEVGNDLIENEIVDIFVCYLDKKSGVTIDINPEEVMSTKWINIDNLISQIRKNPDQFTPWIRIYMDKHREQITL